MRSIKKYSAKVGTVQSKEKRLKLSLDKFVGKIFDAVDIFVFLYVRTETCLLWLGIARLDLNQVGTGNARSGAAGRTCRCNLGFRRWIGLKRDLQNTVTEGESVK